MCIIQAAPRRLHTAHHQTEDNTRPFTAAQFQIQLTISLKEA